MEKARGFWAFLHTPKTRFDLKDRGKAFCYFVDPCSHLLFYCPFIGILNPLLQARVDKTLFALPVGKVKKPPMNCIKIDSFMNPFLSGNGFF